MMNTLSKLRTYTKLGISNVLRVLIYRLGLRFNIHPVQKIDAKIEAGPYFRATKTANQNLVANDRWRDKIERFGWHMQPVNGSPPNWFENPFTDQPEQDASINWWEIPDFGHGDIKGIWELSRFTWMPSFATMAACGDSTQLGRLNNWVEDWVAKNPPFKGPNWKCGQEASFRVLHTVFAAWALEQDDTPSSGLISFVETHLKRISPTVSYAIGQQNNHGTSEAAALFIGGSFLRGHSVDSENWVRKGKYWLEERAKTLIADDGTFSQYSVIYHRLMLDTYSFVEAWRRHKNHARFKDETYTRLHAATIWLGNFTDKETGDAPNIGANDGAHILQLTNCDYRDFRPSVQLAAALFAEGHFFVDGPWDNGLKWLRVPKGDRRIHPKSSTMNSGGFHILRNSRACAVLRFPNFIFRPSQADALHLDFWVDGENLLRDAGTLSYNSERYDWFSGTAAHNTIQFDDRDQMSRIGRFLFDNWLVSIDVEKSDGHKASAAYRDQNQAFHQRSIELTDEALICRDEVSGSFEMAKLRWRLSPDNWRKVGSEVVSNKYTIRISSENGQLPIELCQTHESRYYQKMDEVPAIEALITLPTTVETVVSF